MQGRCRLPARKLSLSVVAVALIAGHGIALRYLASHVALSGAVALAVMSLVVIKHLGWFGALYAVARKWVRSGNRKL